MWDSAKQNANDERVMVRTLADSVIADLENVRRQEVIENEKRIQELNEERYLYLFSNE